MKIFRKITLLVLLLALVVPLSAAKRVRCTTHIYSISQGDTLRLDHYASSCGCGKQPREAVLFMFGGGFKAGSRSAQQYIDFFEWLARRGVDVVSIDYRLGLKDVSAQNISSPTEFVGVLTGAVQMAVEDLYRSTAFVVENSQKWGIDPAKIFAAGSSAGAISVLQGEYLRANNSPLAALLPEDFEYAGIISFAGAVLSVDGQPKWQSVPQPLMLFHGNADSNVPYKELVVPVAEGVEAGMYGSESIFKSLKDADSSLWLISVQGEDHSVAESPMEEYREEILSFMKSSSQQPTTKIRMDVGTPAIPKEFTVMDYITSNF